MIELWQKFSTSIFAVCLCIVLLTIVAVDFTARNTFVHLYSWWYTIVVGFECLICIWCIACGFYSEMFLLVCLKTLSCTWAVLQLALPISTAAEWEFLSNLFVINFILFSLFKALGICFAFWFQGETQSLCKLTIIVSVFEMHL